MKDKELKQEEKEQGNDIRNSKIIEKVNGRRLSKELRNLKEVLNYLKSTVRSTIKDVEDSEIRSDLIHSIINNAYDQVGLFLKKIELSNYLKDFYFFDHENDLETNDLLTFFNHFETLDGLLEIFRMNLDEDKEKDEKLKRDAIYVFLELEKHNDEFVGERVDQFIKYLRIRKECLFQNVIEFINDNYKYICHDDYTMRSLNHLIRGYSKDRINKPWYCIDCIKNGIQSLTDEDFFLPKSEEMFICMVNAAFKDANRRYCPEIENKPKVKKLEN